MVKTKEQKKAYNKDYRETKNGKMVNKICKWKSSGLICDTYYDYLTIYYHWLESTHCEKCNKKFTEGNTLYRKCMDHNHNTGLFRNILCQICNINDRVDNTSGVPNISWYSTQKKWAYAKIIDGKTHCRIFKLKEDAIKYKIEFEKQNIYIN